MLPSFVVDALKIHKDRQDQLRESPKWQEQGLVFTTNFGTPISPRNLIRHFKKKIEEAGLPEIRFHDLRHTTASLLLEKNTHPKVVQELLGHSSIILTLSTYSHVIPSLQREAMDNLDEILK
jgi:integrase